MIFWTLVFLLISLYGLFRGPLFFESTKNTKLLGIDMAQGKIDDEALGKELIKNGCLPLVAALILAIVEVIYLVNAIHYDPLKIPTLVGILYLIIYTVASSYKKNINKMDENELMIERAKTEKLKRFSFSSVIKGLVWTVYFGYMLYILVF